MKVKAVIPMRSEEGAAYYIHTEGGETIKFEITTAAAADALRLLSDFLAEEMQDLLLANFRAEQHYAELSSRLRDAYPDNTKQDFR